MDVCIAFLCRIVYDNINSIYMRRIATDMCRGVSVCAHHEMAPCKNGWTDRDAVWHMGSGGP